MIGDGPCVVKTLTRHHLYCEPPVDQPLPRHHALREAPDTLPEFTVSGQAVAELGRASGMCRTLAHRWLAPHAGADGEPALFPGPCAV